MATNKIEIGNKKYTKELVELFSGIKGATSIKNEWLPVLDALENPQQLPFLVEAIYHLQPAEDLRLALVRIQLDSELRMRENLEQYQHRLYVVQTIEKILYGELLVEGRSKDEDKKTADKAK